jgi:hypothetical protein
MSTPNPREVLDLANEIVKAEDHLSTLKQRWEVLFAGQSRFTANGEAAILQPKKPGRPARSGSLSSMVLALINSGTTEFYDVNYISQTLSADRERVSNTLHNLVVAKKINRVRRGIYAPLNYRNEIARTEIAQ